MDKLFFQLIVRYLIVQEISISKDKKASDFLKNIAIKVPLSNTSLPDNLLIWLYIKYFKYIIIDLKTFTRNINPYV